MDTVNDLMGKASALYEEAKVFYLQPDLSAEDSAKAEKMVADAKAMQARIEKMREIGAAAESLKVEAKQQAHDAPKPSGFKSLREFWTAVALAGNVRYRGPTHPALKMWKGDEGEPAMEDKHTGVSEWKATMIESVGARGGFLVPTEFLENLYAVNPENNPVRSRCTIIPMRRRQINIPVLEQTTATAGIPHWFGGILATWTEEQGTKAQYDPTFRQVELAAHKLVCYSRAGDELLDDAAIGLDAFLRGPMGFVGAINWHEEFAFLQGTGVGQPLGVINAGATIGIAAAAAVGFTLADALNMLEAFLPGASGVWMFNQQHLSNLYGMTDTAGNLVFVPNVNDTAPGRLFGYPVIFTEKLPVPGTAGSAILVDWKYYLIGDRQATTIDSTNQERFRYDETSWRAVHRVDGQPWLSAPLTLQDGTTQVSPFVMLSAKTT